MGWKFEHSLFEAHIKCSAAFSSGLLAGFRQASGRWMEDLAAPSLESLSLAFQLSSRSLIPDELQHSYISNIRNNNE
jgi:hypothetical protein